MRRARDIEPSDRRAAVGERFRDAGTVMFCGHDTNAVMALCDWAIWLDKGRIECIGSAKELCEVYLASIHAQSTGMSAATPRAREATAPAARQRQHTPQHLPQRVEVFEFNEDSASFGIGDARILETRMTRTDGSDLGYLEGGEEVQITIVARIERELASPILGFIINDRLGQSLFGDNTFLSCRGREINFFGGEEIDATFVFEPPFLRSGDYTVTAAIASGTLENHVQHHWVHDALLLTIHSPFRNGVMIGIPMRRISVSVSHHREPITQPACSVEVKS